MKFIHLKNVDSTSTFLKRNYLKYKNDKKLDTIKNYITYNDKFKDITTDMYFDEWADISQSLLECANGTNKDYQGYVNILYKRDNKVLETTAYPNAFINTIGIAFENSKDDNNSLIISNSTIEGVEKGDVLVSVDGKSFENRAEALAYFYSEESQEDFKYEVVINTKDGNKTFEVEGFSLSVLEDNDIAPSKVQIEFSAEYQRDFLKNLNNFTIDLVSTYPAIHMSMIVAD